MYVKYFEKVTAHCVVNIANAFCFTLKEDVKKLYDNVLSLEKEHHVSRLKDQIQNYQLSALNQFRESFFKYVDMDAL